MQLIPQAIFDIFALSLPHGHGFGDRPPIGAWGDGKGQVCGVITQHLDDGSLGLLVMRRRVDSVWAVTAEELGFTTLDAAKARLETLLRIGDLSAVIFSNACSIAKLNRVMISAGANANGLPYTRVGKFFDRRPGASTGVPFCLDVTSDQYRKLWPQGYEPWSAEMEIFHNPFATHPLRQSLLPEATHWFEVEGERVCRSYYETSILWSTTHITEDNTPPLRLEDFVAEPSAEPELPSPLTAN